MNIADEFLILDAAWSAVVAEEGECATLMFQDPDDDGVAIVAFREVADDPNRTAMAAACAQVLTIIGEKGSKPDWIAYAGVAFVGMRKADDPDLDLESIERGDMEKAYLAGDTTVSEQLVIVRVSADGTWMQRFRLPLHEPEGEPWGPNGLVGGAMQPILGGLFMASQIIGSIWAEG